MATSTTAGTPTSSSPASAPKSTDNLAHLKSLVSQLQAKIERLEAQAATSATGVKDSVVNAAESVKDAVLGGLTPAHHLRIVLMGPPGAGKFELLFFLGDSL